VLRGYRVNLGHAAIDEEFDSIDKAAVLGSEEQDSLRNFIGDADPSKRDYAAWEAMKPVI